MAIPRGVRPGLGTYLGNKKSILCVPVMTDAVAGLPLSVTDTPYQKTWSVSGCIVLLPFYAMPSPNL